MMEGICDITEGDSQTKQVYLRLYDKDVVRKQIRRDIKKGLKRVRRVSASISVIIAPTTG